VRLVGRVTGSLMGRVVGFGLGLKPNLRFLGFHLGRVLVKPKSKIWIEGMGRGIPLDSEAGFEVSMGCVSSLGLLRPEVMSTIDLGGGLSAPTNVGSSMGLLRPEVMSTIYFGGGLFAPTSSGLSAPTSVGLPALAGFEFSLEASILT